MVAGHHIVQYSDPVSLFRFKEPFDPLVSVLCELQEEFSFVAAVGDMPDIPPQIVSIGSRYPDTPILKARSSRD